MEESENNLMQQRLKSCSGTTSSSTSSTPIQKPPLDLRGSSFRGFPQSPDSSAKRGLGISPAHPHFPPLPSHLQQIPKNFLQPPPPSHSRSLSQPAFFSLDSLPHFNAPSPPSDPSSSADVAMEDRGPAAVNSHAAPPPVPPPRKLHRRSQSDVPSDFRLAGLPPLPHQGSFPNHLVSPRDVRSVRPHSLLVKQEADWDRDGDGSADRKSDGDAAGDDLFIAYMNLDNLDTLNSSGTEEKREELDSRASGTKTGGDSSENEAESSSVNDSVSSKLQPRREGNKRSAAVDLAPIDISSSRHCRSVSMDSFVGNFSFGEESPKLLPSPGPLVGQHPRRGSMEGANNTFSLEFGNGEFSSAEMKKIMANEKLVEIAMADPKRAKRILANRQSAARSKERKMRYISELEHKVQTLQAEATTLSAQLTLLQRDSAGLTNQNNELKFRLQAMEQQAHLRDALNEALTGEVQRLKLVTGESQLANSLNQQMQLNPHYQMQQVPKQQQQSSQTPHFQMQPQQQSQQQQQKNNDSSKHDEHK
ncbi:transcription factor VIP1-like [Iris pallida]|uniref:Transcription factor VIP1-like n=1 Tax=Iris pallida TaxID=29817 RepID=A0AAX6IDA9_IRIPA|nr:transcription factor VIP1-like [Iris pallida]